MTERDDGPHDRSGAGDRSALPGAPEPLYAVSPSRLLTFLDCPRRYRFQYLDRPTPARRAQPAHTSLGLSVHNALRDWWDERERTPRTGARLVREGWIGTGFRDEPQSLLWRERSAGQVAAYLRGVDPQAHPVGIERVVSFVSGRMRVTGRIDRLDERGDDLVVVDYKTSHAAPTERDARTSLPLALYAAAVWKVFRRVTLRVELHHVPTGAVTAHEHTPQSLTSKVDEARSIAADARAADEDYARHGLESARFPPAPGPLCGWCDFREHCPQGRAAAPEKSPWAALEPPVPGLTRAE